MKDKRVIHLPFTTGNTPWNLSVSERNLGIYSRMAVFSFNKRKNEFDRDNCDYKINFRSNFDALIKIIFFYVWAIPRFDIFHFNSGSTLLNSAKFPIFDSIDLPILKFFRKKIVVTIQGSNGRLENTFIENHGEHNLLYKDAFLPEDSDKLKKIRLKMINRYADIIYAVNPDLLINLRPDAKFRPISKLNNLNKTHEKKLESLDKIRIVHIPSDRNIKGTKYICEVFEVLARNYSNFNFTIYENLNNSDVINIIKSADLLVDQIIIGWYGGISLEAINLGVPVVCYLNNNDFRFISDEFILDLPFINVKISTLYDVIASLLDNPTKINKFIDKGLVFLNKWHDNETIASNVIKDYNSLYERVLL